MIEDFMDEFDALLMKYSIDDIILINYDDNQTGRCQLMKFAECEEGKFLVMPYSGNGEILCECCIERENAD